MPSSKPDSVSPSSVLLLALLAFVLTLIAVWLR